MDLILINENKLKIILTNEDMTALDIKCEDIDYSSTGTRRVFWELLDKAKQQTGFDPVGDRIFVQVHPDKTGGCFMYVTKINTPEQRPPETPAALATDSRPTKAIPSQALQVKETSTRISSSYEKKFKSKLYTAPKHKRHIYVVKSSDTLISLCRQLDNLGYDGKSDVYYDPQRYYLYIEDTGHPPLDIAGEYGERINNPFFGYYLAEHCSRLISDTAVNDFCRLAAGS